VRGKCDGLLIDEDEIDDGEANSWMPDASKYKITYKLGKVEA